MNTLGLRFLANPPADLLSHSGLLAFLSKLKEQDSTGEELKSRIAAVETVRGYLDKPTFDAEAMKAVAAALELNPTPLPATAKTETFRAVAKGLTARADADSFPADLEAAMIHFGPVLAKGPSDLFQDLLREFRQSPSFATHHNQVSSTLAVALGARQVAGVVGSTRWPRAGCVRHRVRCRQVRQAGHSRRGRSPGRGMGQRGEGEMGLPARSGPPAANAIRPGRLLHRLRGGPCGDWLVGSEVLLTILFLAGLVSR